MPLRRSTELFDPENLLGVTFAMTDSATSSQVRVRVCFDALTDRAAADGDGHHWLRAWENHMKRIEQIASDNYDHGKPMPDGLLYVDSLELTPLRRPLRSRKDLESIILSELDKTVPDGVAFNWSLRGIGRYGNRPNWTVDLPTEFLHARLAIWRLSHVFDLDVET